MSELPSIRLDEVPDGKVDARLDAAIRSLQQQAFPAAEEFLSSRHYKHHARPDDVRVLAWHGGQLVGQTVVLWMHAEADSRRLKLAGIGNVCSSPQVRGGGIATGCLNRAMEIARRGRADFALLFCAQRLLGFYGRLGFVPVDNEIALTRADGARYHRDWHDCRMAAPVLRPMSEWPAGPLILDADDF